jgi:LPXTG-site transpeptidase (sortase) family protein
VISVLSCWIERLLWLVALVSLAAALYGYGQGWLWQVYLSRQFDQVLTPDSGVSTGAESIPFNVLPGEVTRSVDEEPRSTPVPYIGKLDIPKLDISVMILEGADGPALLRGIGHIPGTPQPGEHGNTGLAGHRDTFFRYLGRLETHDRLILRTARDTYEYEVGSILIVSPNTREVLANSDKEMLTLVTCYPFYFIGPAPERFVVQAYRTK